MKRPWRSALLPALLAVTYPAAFVGGPSDAQELPANSPPAVLRIPIAPDIRALLQAIDPEGHGRQGDAHVTSQVAHRQHREEGSLEPRAGDSCCFAPSQTVG